MNKKLITGILGILAGILVVFLPAPEGLSREAMLVLGTVVTANVFWIADLIPNFATGLIMISLWAGLGIVQFNEAFGVFSSSAWWIVIGGLGIGSVATKTGLVKRVALNIMRFFPLNYGGQSLALFVAGTAVAPAIPSTNAKGAIAAPISRSISESLGYEEGSDQSAGIFMSMVWGFLVSGAVFLSATSINYAIKGLLPENVQAQLAWADWFKVAIPWALVSMVGGYFALQFLYKPKNEQTMSKETILKQIADLGPMSREEKITAIVLAITLIFWVLERQLGISASISAIISLSVLVGFGVMKPAEFKNSIGWDVAIFIGTAMSLGTVLGLVGVSEWLKVNLSGVITPLLDNPFLTVVVLALIIYAAKFILVSLITSSTIFLLILIPFFEGLSYNPVILVFIVATSINIWFLPYMNPPYLTTSAAVNNKMALNKHAMVTSVVYMILNILGLLISLPYWQMIGLI
ncbi:SLC13 family permease [Streptococcus sp. E29BA]|uniref:SLC13 family permease n=1 Tax=Streptococcus sp. E29BA TaxID=3278716 RepID=UPI00359DCD78